MPFEPLTPEEEQGFKPPCMSPEHDPPSHMVIRRPMRWVCPACGVSVIIRPVEVRWGGAGDPPVRMSCEAPNVLTPEQVSLLRGGRQFVNPRVG